MKWLHPGILCGDFNLSKDPLMNIGQKERKLKDDTAVQQEFEGSQSQSEDSRAFERFRQEALLGNQ